MNNIENLFEFKKFVIYDKKKKKNILEIDNIYPQHYYPITILDYAIALKEYIKSNQKKIPIISLMVKDYPICDFNCKDCLSHKSREWALKNIDKLIFEINTYKKVLKQISNYSEKNGCKSIRLEFCGEGNPDLYKYRDEIIEYANKECNMKIVYVSTGSKLSKKNILNLVKNAYFIRISFPGIDEQSYTKYSRQKCKKQFDYNDALTLLKELIKLRKKNNREQDLLIGVRASIRNEFNDKYFSFSKKMDDIGIDCIQFVKIIRYNSSNNCNQDINKDLIKELKYTSEYKYYKNIKQIQIPTDLDKVYRDRIIMKNSNICFSSFFSPLLYGNHLITCTHWDKIMDKKYHYGTVCGNEKEIYNLFDSNNMKMIQENINNKCDDCCSIYDNTILNKIYGLLSKYENIDSLEFKIER